MDKQNELIEKQRTKILELQAHLRRYERLTPQGSEFYNNYSFVYDYLEDKIKSRHSKMMANVDLRRQVEHLKSLCRENGVIFIEEET